MVQSSVGPPELVLVLLEVEPPAPIEPPAPELELDEPELEVVVLELDAFEVVLVPLVLVPVVVVGLVELLQPSRAATRVPAARPRNESTPVRFIR